MATSDVIAGSLRQSTWRPRVDEPTVRVRLRPRELPAERQTKIRDVRAPHPVGDRFIGRIDPQMDRRHEKLLINSVHAEPGAPAGKEVSSKIGERIDDLAEFLGAK